MNHAAGGSLVHDEQGFQGDHIEQKGTPCKQHEPLDMVGLGRSQCAFLRHVGEDDLVKTQVIESFGMELVPSVGDGCCGFDHQTNVQLLAVKTTEGRSRVGHQGGFGHAGMGDVPQLSEALLDEPVEVQFALLLNGR